MSGRVNEIDLKQESADPFEFLLDVTRRGSDTVHYEGPVGETYIFNHPDDIRHVLQSQDFSRTTLIKIVLGKAFSPATARYGESDAPGRCLFSTAISSRHSSR